MPAKFKAPKPLRFPIVLTSPCGSGRRRVQPDGFIEMKRPGHDWEPAPFNGDPFIRIERIRGYVTTMTEIHRWKQS